MLMVGRLPGPSTPAGSDANGHGFNVTYRSGRGGSFPVSWIFKIKHREILESSHLFTNYKLASDAKTTAASSHSGVARFQYLRTRRRQNSPVPLDLGN